MYESNEQKLIDICFQLVLTAADKVYYEAFFKNKTREEISEWIADQLRQCGFDTEPRGASWGVLK